MRDRKNDLGNFIGYRIGRYLNAELASQDGWNEAGNAVVVWVWHGDRPCAVRIVLRDVFPRPLAAHPLAPLRRAHDGLD